MPIEFALGSWRVRHEALNYNSVVPFAELTTNSLNYLYWSHSANPAVHNKPENANDHVLYRNPLSNAAIQHMENLFSDKRIWGKGPMFDPLTLALTPPRGLSTFEFLNHIAVIYEKVNNYQILEGVRQNLVEDVNVHDRLLVSDNWKDFYIFAELDMLEAVLISWVNHNGYYEKTELNRAKQYEAGILSSLTAMAAMIPFDPLGRVGLPLTKARTDNSRKIWRSLSHMRQLEIMELVTPMNATFGRTTSYLCLTKYGRDLANEMTRHVNEFVPLHI